MAKERFHIEKNTVQETLLIPLYGRKICSERFPDLFRDPFAAELCAKLDYDFSEFEKRKNSIFYEFVALEVAMRQLGMIWEIEDYLKRFPNASAVSLGCGLDRSAKIADNGRCKMINLDFPDIISVRDKLIPSGDREQNLACDLNDHRWMEQIDGRDGAIFFAAGVFHYFKKEDVKALVCELAERFPKARLVFDSVGKTGLKMMISKTLEPMGFDGIEAFFYVENPKRELRWSKQIQVSCRHYMNGYYDLKSKNIKIFHRLMSKFCDHILKMSIVRMDFL